MRASGVIFEERPQTGETAPTTFEDMSRWKNHGTITGATPTRLPSGLWYYQYDKSSSDRIDLGAAVPEIDNLIEGTVCMWVNQDWVSSNEVFFGHEVDVNNRLTLYVNNAGQTLSTYLATTAGGGVGLSGGALIAGRWMHVAATFGPSGHSLYLDGVFQNTNASTNSFAGMGTSVITQFGGRGSEYYNGGIALPKILDHYPIGNELVDMVQNEKTKFGFGV